MMRCDNCGTLLGPADAFCDNCGTPSGTAGNGNETRDARTAGIPPAAYQTVPPQRHMGWPRTFFAHGEARGPGRTSSATRYLSAAAYLNPGYAGLVIRELINSHRAVAPSVGMDLGPIVRHCLRARRIQLTRDIVLSVLLLAELILSPVLTVCIIIAGFFLGYLPSANWARRSRGTKILAGIGAGLLLLGLLAVVIFIAIIGAVVSYLHGLGSASSPGLGTIGQSAPSGGITPRGVVELLLLAAMFATQVAYLHVRSRTLIEELAPDAHPRRSGPGMSLVESRIADVEAAQHGNLVLYSGPDPFVGTGTRTRAWSIAIELQRASDSGHPARQSARSGSYVPVDPVELHDVVRERLLRLKDEELPPNERLNAMTVHDHIVGPGQQRWDSPLIDPERSTPFSQASPEAVAAIIRHPQAQVRYYQRVSVCDEGQSVSSGPDRILDGADQDIAASAFVYVAVEGRMLYLEFVSTVLPPVHPSYRVVDLLPKLSRGSFWAKVLLDTVKSVLRDLAFAPFRMLRSLRSMLQESHLYQAEADASKEYLYGDIGARISVRELGAEKRLATYIQKLDAEKYTKFTERLVIDTVLDFLRAKGVDVSAYVSSAGTVINSNTVIEGGSFSGNIALGVVGPVQQQTRAPSVPG